MIAVTTRISRAITVRGRRRPWPASRRAGFVLLFILIAVASLMVGGAVLASMSIAGTFSAFSQARSKEAREAAEQGVDVIISSFNASANRKLLVAKVPLNSWSQASNINRLRNPCAPGTDPTTAALQLGGNRENAIAGDSRRVFVLKTITLRNPGRSASYVSSSDAAGDGGVAGLSSGTYSEIGIGLDPDATTANGGFIEVVVEGRIYDAAGRLKSSAQVTREFAVIPKCCGIGFAGPYGNDNRLCAPPSIVLGLNGGGLRFTGSPDPSPTVRQASGLLDPSASGNKPASILCLSSSALCGTRSSLDGVPLHLVGMAPAPPPAYPSCSGASCSTGYSINTVTTSGLDYIRVDATGNQVEICNVADNNTLATSSREPALPASVSGCHSSINSSCLRQVDASGPVFYCRISELTVLDAVPSTGVNGSLSNRRQNNTLWIDTTRGSIYLYLNQLWARPWTTTGSVVNLVVGSGPYRDGQIQHLSCLDSSGAIQASYEDVGICAQLASPRDLPRAMIYSDASIQLALGDDGFLRDLLVYLPSGTVSVSHPSTAGCDPPRPALRAVLWIDTLAFTRGSNCTLSPPSAYANASAMQLVVPPSGAQFSTSEERSPILHEWVARGSTFTRLY